MSEFSPNIWFLITEEKLKASPDLKSLKMTNTP